MPLLPLLVSMLTAVLQVHRLHPNGGRHKNFNTGLTKAPTVRVSVGSLCQSGLCESISSGGHPVLGRHRVACFRASAFSTRL